MDHLSVQDKLKRLKPIIRAKQAILDKETLVLAKLIREKEQNIKDLKASQESYLKGVNQLVVTRNDPSRVGLDAMERCVDYSKTIWTELFKENQKIEKQISSQRMVINVAKRKLKEIEKLEERYVEQWKQFDNKQENIIIDEFSSNKHHRLHGK